jgi:hypothetical protein
LLVEDESTMVEETKSKIMVASHVLEEPHTLSKSWTFKLQSEVAQVLQLASMEFKASKRHFERICKKKQKLVDQLQTL